MIQNKVIMYGVVCAAVICSAFFYAYQKNDAIREKPIVVIVPSYNNKEWYGRNLDSIFAQKYANYHVVYIDDCSPDGTGDLVAQYIQEKNVADKITLIKNETNKGAMANIYTAVMMQPDDPNLIMVTVDGDDWLTTPQALQIVNNAYQDPDVWMTYGSYRVYPQGVIGQCCEFPTWVKARNAYRQFESVGANRCSHLRTFYAWLFKQIPTERFMRNGSFLSVNCDKAQMFAMLELAGGRYKFIPEVLYAYNCATALNDYKVRLQEQLTVSKEIHAQASLKPIKDILA